MAERMPFPGPALATRIVGEVTRDRLATVRSATAIVEEELAGIDAFQYMAVLLEDQRHRHPQRETRVRPDHRRAVHPQRRCARGLGGRDSLGQTLHRICRRITEIPGVNRCLYDLTPKPPATIEYV